VSAIVRLVGVEKRFGELVAIKGVDLEVSEGEKIGLYGPNGSGKSTLLRLIATQTPPTRGTIWVNGVDTQENPVEAKKSIGYLGHQSFLYDELSLEENLAYYGAFLNAPPQEIDRVIEVTGAEKWRHTKAGKMSYGMRKRGDIARALLCDPPILLLDEFLTGLDAGAAERITEYLRGREDLTLVATSHNPEALDRLCSKTIHLEQGQIRKGEEP